MIIEIHRGNQDRSKYLAAVMREVKSALKDLYPLRYGQQQIALIILELVKNTLDHSNGDGRLEFLRPSSACAELFAYTDSGQAFDWHSPGEAYGASDKRGNGVNHGLGKMVIVEATKSAGLVLRVQRQVDATVFRFNVGNF